MGFAVVHHFNLCLEALEEDEGGYFEEAVGCEEVLGYLLIVPLDEGGKIQCFLHVIVVIYEMPLAEQQALPERH